MASNILSTNITSNLTRPSTGNKLIWDGISYYWAFYLKASIPNTLYYSYSSNLVNWIESSVTLSTGVNYTDGGEIFAQIYSTGNVIVTYFNNTIGLQYMQGSITGTIINWWPTYSQYICNSLSIGGKASFQSIIGINNTIAVLMQDSSGNSNVYKSTNIINNNFIDTGSQWTCLQTIIDNNDVSQSDLVSFSTVANQFIVVQDDNNGSVNQIVWCPVDGGVHSNQVLYSGANVSRSNWGAIQLSNNYYYVLGQSDVSTFSFFGCATWNSDSTVFTSLSAPIWPINGLAVNSGVALITDGINIWVAIIGGDSKYTISFNKYTTSLGTWSGWVNTTTNINTKAYISPINSVINGKLVFMWVEGTNPYNLVVADLNASRNITSSTSTMILMSACVSNVPAYSRQPLNIQMNAVTSSISNTALYSVTSGNPTVSYPVLNAQMQAVLPQVKPSSTKANSSLIFLTAVNTVPNPPRTTMSGVFI